MSNESFDDRRRALEEAFFAKQDAILRQRLAEPAELRARKEAFTAVSGITDPVVLDQLAALDITPETLAAISLVPLVAVAWADGSVDARERAAVLHAAGNNGLKPGAAGYQMLEKWLESAPPASLVESWKAYIRVITAGMDRASRRALQGPVMDRAHTVALAAGGFLGIGMKISYAEEEVLADLAKTFNV
ncbi:MAG: hypothetical protein IT555_02485 [Acetobacteraceae bacterium]|nr:hypothetical protein [Acetobacteraceae bacterium]